MLVKYVELVLETSDRELDVEDLYFAEKFIFHLYEVSVSTVKSTYSDAAGLSSLVLSSNWSL